MGIGGLLGAFFLGLAGLSWVQSVRSRRRLDRIVGDWLNDHEKRLIELESNPEPWRD